MLVGTVIFLSLIVILLAMPVTVTYQFSFRDRPSGDARLDWAFGLASTVVSLDRATSKRGKPGADRKKAARRRKSTGKNTNVVAGIRQPSFRRRILRLLLDVWHAIHKKNVELLVHLGLGDPADTGQLWAVLGPMSAMFAQCRDIRIAIEPDFLEATLAVDSSGTIRVIPLQMAIIMLGLLVSPPIWRGVMAMRATG